MARKYHQGVYKLQNPHKYKGDPTNIVWRSSWELHFNRYCDLNSAVIEWVSEETVIPYYYDIDGKMHRYFVDYWMRVMKPDGTVETLLIEIKPYSQIIKPNVTKMTKSNKEKILTWTKNQCKWKAADAYAKQRGWTFKVLSERELGIK